MSQPEPSIPLSDDEPRRLATLHACQILDTPAEAEFDFLVELAARLCQVSAAALVLVDGERVWCKACCGNVAVESARAGDPNGLAILQEAPLLIPDLAADQRVAGFARSPFGQAVRMYAGAPLQSHSGERIGALCVLDTHPHELDADRVALLAGLATQAMALIDRRRLRCELLAAQSVNARLATIDETTGLLKRQVLLDRLDDEVERAHRFGTPLSVALLAIDGFKAINDRHGHAAGDVLLRNFGNIVRDELRQVDSAGRYGDGELCILLPGTVAAGGITLAEALRGEIEQYEHAYGDRCVLATASIGLATRDVLDGGDATALLRAADDALRQAKRSGNRVQHATHT